MKRPRILITNDDGIDAPGILYLRSALQDIADLTVVAPAFEQSGVGLGISFSKPLILKSVAWENAQDIWCVTGTPADCVKMGIDVVLKSNPDLVVSGINRGTNAGRSLLYSGTVGGAIEATFRGIPGIAFSAYEYNTEQAEYKEFTKYISKFVQSILENPLPSGTILNVNFPSRDTKNLNSQPGFRVKLTRQGKQYWIGHPYSETKNDIYELHSKVADYEEDIESDIYWLAKGYITAAPVHVDELTDWRYLNSKKAYFESLFG